MAVAKKKNGAAARAMNDARAELIAGLNADLNHELEAMLRYLYHSATATSLLGHELREAVKADIAGELQHAVFLADKIVALGGQVKLDVKMPRETRSAKQMLQEDIKFEREAIADYTKRIEQARVVGALGLITRLESILAEETDHAEDLERLSR
jgi:bacterioferritin